MKPRNPELAAQAAGEGKPAAPRKGRPGRPPIAEARERLLIKLPVELKRELEQEAFTTRRPMAAIVAEALGARYKGKR